MHKRFGPFSFLAPFRSNVEEDTILNYSSHTTYTLGGISSGVTRVTATLSTHRVCDVTSFQDYCCPVEKHSFDTSIHEMLNFFSPKSMTPTVQFTQSVKRLPTAVPAVPSVLLSTGSLKIDKKFEAKKIVDIATTLEQRILDHSMSHDILGTLAYVPSTKEYLMLKSLLMSDYLLPGTVEALVKLPKHSFVLCIGYQTNMTLADSQIGLSGTVKKGETNIQAALREVGEEAFLNPNTIKFEGTWSSRSGAVAVAVEKKGEKKREQKKKMEYTCTWYSVPINDCMIVDAKTQPLNKRHDHKNQKVGVLIHGSELELTRGLSRIPVKPLQNKRECEAYFSIIMVDYLLSISKIKSSKKFWCQYPFTYIK